jgi:hypothetical protein
VALFIHLKEDQMRDDVGCNEVVTLKAKDVPLVSRLIQLGRKWTVFSLKSNPEEFYVIKTPMGQVVHEHLKAKYGDDLGIIYQPDAENCDLCPHPHGCPRDQAKLRQITKIGLPA